MISSRERLPPNVTTPSSHPPSHSSIETSSSPRVDPPDTWGFRAHSPAVGLAGFGRRFLNYLRGRWALKFSFGMTFTQITDQIIENRTIRVIWSDSFYGLLTRNLKKQNKTKAFLIQQEVKWVTLGFQRLFLIRTLGYLLHGRENTGCCNR